MGTIGMGHAIAILQADINNGMPKFEYKILFSYQGFLCFLRVCRQFILNIPVVFYSELMQYNRLSEMQGEMDGILKLYHLHSRAPPHIGRCNGPVLRGWADADAEKPKF
jgi:hypothetical protein